ncbi:MAG: serine O-acetyltransferase [Actinobacteria bacterium RBG_16_64_13]|nr:MAG: serine O-acetyltransferase [Actinobacteria bacterium RBG_16_64_13]
MGTRTRRPAGNASGSGAFTALVLAGAAFGFLRTTETGKRLAAVMARDIQAIKERDPAARNDLEIVTCYPGLHALWLHRLSGALWRRGVPLAPRLVSQFARFITGIEIHPGATLGDGLFIDHGAGVVIGETAEVGENVTIYQGVTLGGTGKESGKRHPTVGDNVVIGAGSLLLGSIKVGDNVKVGSGSVVVHDVPSDTTVVGNPGRPVISEGTKVGIPDIDYTHLPDPVAEAMKCLVRRVVQLENELEEVRKASRSSLELLPEGPVASHRPPRPVPAEEIACDPVRLDGIPDI